MKKIIKPIAAYLLSGCLLASCQPQSRSQSTTMSSEESSPKDQVAHSETSSSKIQLALIIDTSGSMDGLIEQAKNQLWKIVLELAKTKAPNGEDPRIEIALYHYGNDRLEASSGYVKKLSDLTTELDIISEELFALSTDGGSEFCGTVIQTSINDLKWSDDPNDLKLIYIAGNEGFDQGMVNYHEACALANNTQVNVNTIFCGPRTTGIELFWQDGATLGKGTYSFIDSDQKTVHYNTPFDDEITTLNQQLNTTYIAYNHIGNRKKEKQIAEDMKAQNQGSAFASKRYLSKASKVYKNSTWDLVDASKEKSFSMEQIDNSALPDSLNQLDQETLKIKIDILSEKRKNIKQKLSDLNIQRSEYIASIKKGRDQENPLETAIINGLHQLAQQKGFTFQDAIN